MSQRTGWGIEKKVAGSFTSDGTIFRPNNDFPIEIVSTQQTINLSDGSNAFVTPQTKFIDLPLTFTWLWEDGTTKTQVEGYITNQDDLRITDHDGNLYIGRFVNINSIQIVGQDPDRYNISALFQPMPGLA